MGGGPVSNTGEFDRVHGDVAWAETEAQVFNLGLFKITFFWFKEQVVVFEPLEDEIDEVTMFFNGGSGDQDVVHINEDLPCVNEVFEHLIHHGLECGW